MPPIDPAVLKARAAALAAQFDTPAAVAAGVRALLDDYADRTHRPSPKVAASHVENAYKTPPPVVRTVVAALRGPAQAQPAAALSVLEGLWAGRSREERLIAAELLGHVAPALPAAEVMGVLEVWVTQLESSATAEAVATHGLGPLVVASPGVYLEHARRWVASPRRWSRRFALAVLLPLIADRQWDNVPGALAVVRPVMADPDAEVRRAAADVLARLARKSPAEIRQFLREHAARHNNFTHWIVRNAMKGLSPADQSEIVKVLRS